MENVFPLLDALLCFLENRRAAALCSLLSCPFVSLNCSASSDLAMIYVNSLWGSEGVAQIRHRSSQVQKENKFFLVFLQTLWFILLTH